MNAVAHAPSQRVVADGDTVTLEFFGVVQKTQQAFRIEHDPERTFSWSSHLIGHRSGDTVVLPEAEENEVTAVILSIDR